MKVRALTLSNDPVAEQAAQEYLLGGGSALGAVLCGFFAAAGAHAGVLLGPVTALVAGVGSGARAFDGRLRQPGRGTKRPRGFRPSDKIPDAARVAVPASVAALLVALAYDTGQKISTILRSGIVRAERGGAESRADLLRRIRGVGAAATTEPAFTRPLLHVAGPSQGGLLTPSDFGSLGDVDHAASEQRLAAGTLVEAPWAADPPKQLEGLGIGCAVCAADVRGTFAVVLYRRVVDGLPIEELELEVPLVAVPVLRGITRVTPGAPLPAPAAAAIRRDVNGTPFEVVAAPGATKLDASLLEAAPLVLRRNSRTEELEIVRH